MIEALACGTPVIGWRRGSVPEVIDHGVTGYIVDNIVDAVDAVKRIDSVSRMGCRQAFERRFDASPGWRRIICGCTERVIRTANADSVSGGTATRVS